MCLITNKQPKIATEDIEVLKVLHKSLVSPFQNFQYELNKIYYTELSTELYGTPCCSIDTNYLNNSYYDYTKSILNGELLCYERGFHSCLKLRLGIHLKTGDTRELFKCIIPKGSTYVEDFVGFIISDQIIIKEQFMGTLLNPSPDLAQNVLDNWFKTKNKITSLEFKGVLRTEYPDYEWTQFFCSKFLFQNNLSFDDNGTYRTYYAPNVCSMSFEEAFNTSISELEENEIQITKKNLKKELAKLGFNQGIDYESSDFESHFDESDLRPTGKHNSENHNIYVRVGSGQHYSKTKDSVISTSLMHKNHIENALKKNYSTIKVEDFLDPNTRLYDLLQAYFTWDLRQRIKGLV